MTSGNKNFEDGKNKIMIESLILAMAFGCTGVSAGNVTHDPKTPISLKELSIRDANVFRKMTYEEVDKPRREGMQLVPENEMKKAMDQQKEFLFNLVMVILAGVASFLIIVLCGKFHFKVVTLSSSWGCISPTSQQQTFTVSDGCHIAEPERPRYLAESVSLMTNSRTNEYSQDYHLSIHQMSPAIGTPPPSYMEVVQLGDPSLPTYDEVVGTLDPPVYCCQSFPTTSVHMTQ